VPVSEPVEGKNAVAVALAENDAVSEPVAYKAAEPVPLRVVSLDSAPLAGRKALAVPLAENDELSDPLADRKAEPFPFAEKL